MSKADMRPPLRPTMYSTLLFLEEPGRPAIDFIPKQDVVGKWLKEAKVGDMLGLFIIRDMVGMDEPDGQLISEALRAQEAWELISDAIRSNAVEMSIKRYSLDDLVFGVGALKKNG